MLGRLSDHRLWAYGLVAPALLMVAFVVLYPVATGMWLSVHDVRPTRPWLGTPFIGLRHFADLLDDPLFHQALVNTAVWATSAVLLELALGLAAALLLVRDVPGMRVVAVIVLIPWFLPNVVAGHMWGLLLDSRLGAINDVLVRLGILSSYKAWFADPTTALAAAVLVEVWHGFPFFTLMLMAALRGIPNELVEAARVDGATAFQRFRHITLPLLSFVILVTVVLRVMSLVNSPELLLILTQGGPGHSTMVLSLLAFETAYRAYDFGLAAAMSVVALVILMAFTFVYVRLSGVART